MNKKSSSLLKRVRMPRTPAEWLEAVMNFIFFLCGMLAVGCVVLITVYMVISGVPAIHKISFFKFLLGTKWASTATEPLFGILPFILSSIYGTQTARRRSVFSTSATRFAAASRSVITPFGTTPAVWPMPDVHTPALHW